MGKIKVHRDFDNSVVRIVLDDGKGNILDAMMMGELLAVFDTLRQDRHVKLVTFEGEGGNFSFGASVEEHTRDKAAGMLRSFHQIFYDIIDLGIPTAAKISGQCLGGGLELALICNVLFAEESAVLGQPEIVLGVFPPPASIILPMKIGQARAEELLITGRSFKAAEARSIGLVHEVFKDARSMQDGVNAWIEKHILKKSASSLRFSNKMARKHFNTVLLDHLPAAEEIYINDLMKTRDANEGIQSFLEKRKPVWENC